MGEHHVQETLSYPSRLPIENPTLRNGSGEEWSGACPLGTPRRDRQDLSGTMAACLSQHSSDRRCYGRCSIFKRPHHHSFWRLLCGLLSGNCFLPVTIVREDLEQFASKWPEQQHTFIVLLWGCVTSPTVFHNSAQGPQ